MKIVKKNIILIILMLLISVTIFAESFDHAGTNIVERIRLFEGEEEVEIDENFGKETQRLSGSILMKTGIPICQI